MTNEKTKRIEKLADDLMNGELPGEWSQGDNVMTQEIKITMMPYSLPLPNGQRLGMWDVTASGSGDMLAAGTEMISVDVRLYARLDKDGKVIRLDKRDEETEGWVKLFKNLPNDERDVKAVRAAVLKAAAFLAKETPEEYQKRKKHEENLKNLDIGFRVLKQVDEPAALAGTDNVYACAIELGLGLTQTLVEEQFDGRTVYTYGDNDMVCCFDGDVPDSVVRAAAEKKPKVAVFLAAGVDRKAVRQIFAGISPETDLKVMV